MRNNIPYDLSMAIDTTGYITVVEAAKRLGLSIEQVRRKLREGKLKGYRVGNQWFVEVAQLEESAKEAEPLIPRELIEDVARVRRQIGERNPGYVFDAVEMLKRHRGEC